MNVDRYTEQAQIWLNKAKDDLLWAEDSFNSKHFGGACFISQQAVEKALKAFLFSQKQKLIRTHNLERLLEKCLAFENSFIDIRHNCHILNDYYIDTRYPDIWDVTRFEDYDLAKEALFLAKEAVAFVDNLLFELNLTKSAEVEL